MIEKQNWHGRNLQAALSEQPSLSLDFYSYGVMLRKREGEQISEYPIDPAQAALTLAARVTFDTGLLTGCLTPGLCTSGSKSHLTCPVLPILDWCQIAQ